MRNAVTRAPQQISLEEAIEAYTLNGAYVMQQEQKAGRLEVGKATDSKILNQNIFDIPPTQIGNNLVLNTYLHGRLIFSRSFVC